MPCFSITLFRPLEGVTLLVGDITTNKTAEEILAALGDFADVVLCDGAADVTGLRDIDEQLHFQLLSAAITLLPRLLRPNGNFLAKIFKGPNVEHLKSQLRTIFQQVDIAKPIASRDRSSEVLQDQNRCHLTYTIGLHRLPGLSSPPS